jgi:hypothetical protein
MQSVEASFAALRGTLSEVDGAVRSLYPVADKLPTSLTDLLKLSGVVDPAVKALSRPVTQLVPFAQTLLPLSVNLDHAITSLSPQIGTVNKVTNDLVLCKTGFQNFFQWNASMSKFGDIRGPIPRGNVVLGLQSSSLLNDPGEVAPTECSPGQPIGGRVPSPQDMH